MLLTILIVDDEETVRKMLRVVLTSENTDFLEAKDGTEALKVAREHCGNIDLLISDVVMPGRMNGTEMAAQLSEARPEMKIVLMSGYPPESLTMKPAWIFIQKPFGAPEIRERIANILTDHRVAA
jgi:two-component system, cell cycle sensor histidine kinase and response regulator CckA